MADWSTIGGGGVRSESFGEDTSASTGTTITIPTTAHTKSSWVELIASTSFDYDNCILVADGSNDDIFFDIGVGGAGSEQVIAENLLLTGGSSTSAFKPVQMLLPINIPAGTRIAARAQRIDADGGAIRISGNGFAQGFLNTASNQKIITIGANAGTTKGTDIPDPGANNTKGSWGEITASTSDDIKGFFFNLGLQGDIVAGDRRFLLDIGIGGAGSEQVILSNYSYSKSSEETIYPQSSYFIPIAIPAGTRIAARHQVTSSGVDSVTGIIIYGVK